MSLDALLDKQGTLQRKIAQRGRVGGQNLAVFEPDAGATNVPCSVQPSSANTQIKYLQREITVSHSLYFDQNWDAKTGDRWVVNGIYYIVHGWYESLLIADSWTCDAQQTVL